MDFDVEKIKRSAGYLQNRVTHANAFREVFTKAFEDSEEAQVVLTGALSMMCTYKAFDEALKHLQSLDSLCASKQDEASLCYFKGLAYDFMNCQEEMEENYDRFLELNTVKEPIYIFFPYVRRAKLLHKACSIFKSQEYLYKALNYYIERGREKEKSLNLNNLYFDLASSLMFCHDYKAGIDFVERAHSVWDEEADEGSKMIEMMLLELAGKEDDAKNKLESIDKSSRVYFEAEQILNRLIKKTEPHYYVIEPKENLLDKFWIWFKKNEKKLYKLAYSDKCEDLQKLLSKEIRKIADYMGRELAFSFELDGENITVFAITDYVTSLDYTYERLFEKKPDELEKWSFYTQEEMEIYD